MSADSATLQETHPAADPRSSESDELWAAFTRARGADLPQPSRGDKVGRYTVLDRLGEGGMGVVYKAYDPKLDRNVALKLLRRIIHDDEQGAELRLLREAQMLAKLQHPNVVAVFDTGLTDHGVFIAMELVHGCTLREWIEQRIRSVAELVEVFRAAGQGLAAAHEAGFVHRDFKPANVVVGDDGSVRVLDFGVASLVDPRAAAPTTALVRHPVSRPPGASEPLSGSGLHLTEDGCVVGTPAYMAPEQIAGERVDHRSDQFTFCVCLHLALYGHSPVIGEGLEERRWNMARGRLLDERGMLMGPTEGRVSPRLRAALRRGLSADPASRFPSMRALLDELDEPPRRWSLVVAASTLVLGFAGGMILDANDGPCAARMAGLEQEWGDDARRAVRIAFGRSGHPQAHELHGRVEQQLDRYAEAWTEMYAESCHATFVTRQQSEQLYDQRLRCLERRRSRMHAATAALRRIEGPQQAAALTLLPFQLPRIADCAELETVGAALPLPEEPELRRRVVMLRSTIDEVETMKAAGDFQPGLTLAGVVVENARVTGYPAVLAEALESLGSLQVMGGSARQAQATLEDSILTAAEAGDDATAARSWTWLIYALVQQRRLELGKSLELAARAAVERADDDQVRGWLLNNLGALHGAAGDVERSLALLEQALDVKQRVLGEDHVDVGISWFNLGTARLEQGYTVEARRALERARSIFEATVGSAHPLTIHAIGGLCQVEHELGNYEAAIELCGRVVADYEASPSSHVTMGRNELVMAKALRGAGRGEEARAHAERARELVRDDDPELAQKIAEWLANSRSRAAGSRPPR